MVEATLISTNKNELFWIYDHKQLYWAPGEFHSENESSVVVKCLKTGEVYDIKDETKVVVHPTCLGKFLSRYTSHNFA